MKRFLWTLIVLTAVAFAGCDSVGLENSKSTLPSDRSEPAFAVAGKALDTAVKFKGNYYAMVDPPTDEGMTWWDAYKAAASLEAMDGCTPHLATLTSQEENDFVAETFPEAWKRGYWLGGFQWSGNPEGSPETGWSWVTGEPWLFTNWAKGEPNDIPYDERALQFSGPYDQGGIPGAWNDLTEGEPAAGDPYGFVAEWSCEGAANGGTRHRASGSLQWHRDGRAFVSLAFAASSRADGSTNGRFEMVMHGPGYHFGGDVLCLAVVGNQAWFAGVTKQSDVESEIGVVSGFRVVDHGEGGVQDQTAYPVSLPYGDVDTAADWCRSLPDLLLFPNGNNVLQGNIQVK